MAIPDRFRGVQSSRATLGGICRQRRESHERSLDSPGNRFAVAEVTLVENLIEELDRTSSEYPDTPDKSNPFGPVQTPIRTTAYHVHVLYTESSNGSVTWPRPCQRVRESPGTDFIGTASGGQL